MLTWRLWRALRYPPVSPLLRMKSARLPQSPLWPLRRLLAWRGVLPKLLLLVAALVLMERFGVAGLLLGAFAVPGAIVLIFLGLPLLLPLASLFLGSYWAADISRNIRRERVTRTWDLVCATPDRHAGRQPRHRQPLPVAQRRLFHGTGVATDRAGSVPLGAAADGLDLRRDAACEARRRRS